MSSDSSNLSKSFLGTFKSSPAQSVNILLEHQQMGHKAPTGGVILKKVSDNPPPLSSSHLTDNEMTKGK